MLILCIVINLMSWVHEKIYNLENYVYGRFGIIWAFKYINSLYELYGRSPTTRPIYTSDKPEIMHEKELNLIKTILP